MSTRGSWAAAEVMVDNATIVAKFPYKVNIVAYHPPKLELEFK